MAACIVARRVMGLIENNATLLACTVISLATGAALAWLLRPGKTYPTVEENEQAIRDVLRENPWKTGGNPGSGSQAD